MKLFKKESVIQSIFALGLAVGLLSWTVFSLPSSAAVAETTVSGDEDLRQIREVKSDEIVDEVDFGFNEASGTIFGQLLFTGTYTDENPILEIEGDVFFRSNPKIDQKNSHVYRSVALRNGQFEISIPEGSYLLELSFDKYGGFVVAKETPITIGASEIVSIEIPVEIDTGSASIMGSAFDFRSGEKISIELPELELSSPEIYVSGYPAPKEGGIFDYSFDVHPSTWVVQWGDGIFSSEVDGYAKLNQPDMVVTATENQTSTINLPLAKKDAIISGQLILDQPLPLGDSISIRFDGLGDLSGLYFWGGDRSGRFSVNLPWGDYMVTAYSYGAFGYLNHYIYTVPPKPLIISVDEGETLNNLNIQVGSDVDTFPTVSGSIFAQNYPEKGEVELSLRHAEGYSGYLRFPIYSSKAIAVADFSARLRPGEWEVDAKVLSDGDTWSNIGKIYVEDDTSFAIEVFPDHVFYETAEHIIDPLVDGKIGLSDGISVTVPAEVLTDTAQIQLDLKQGNYLAANGDYRPVGSAYALTARHSLSQLPYADFEFDQPIEVTIPYDLTELEPLLANEIKVMIRPSNELLWWMPPTLLEVDDLVVDTEAQTITFTIDATAQFGLVAPAGALPQPPTFESVFPNRAFFPIVGR